MTQETRKTGRPPGQPKTGGRTRGTKNKKTIVLREKFAEAGFDFVAETMRALKEVGLPESRLEALVRLAPYFMTRLKEEEVSLSDLPVDTEDELDLMPTAQLLELVKP